VHAREDGYSLIELLVVMVIMAILVSAGLAFHFGARERAADATAKSNIRTAVPAIEAYRGDNQGYDGNDGRGAQEHLQPRDREHRGRVDRDRRLLRLDDRQRSHVVEAGPVEPDLDGLLLSSPS
jgi:prepilin-type N-terminal cleavage/methylation domain-containing protein